MPRKSRLAKEKAAKATKRLVDLRDSPPSGRKAKSEKQTVKEIARANTEVAMDQLIRLMNRSRSDVVRLQAIEQLLNRGWGKPVQAMAGPDGEGPIPIVTEVRRVFVKPGDKA